MKSIKALALTIVLGLTGLAYAAGQAQDKATNARKSTAASCCTAGADCCANGGSACCQAHHAKHDGTQHAAHAASNA
ncbi:MAG: hypothetical protein M3Q76_10090, partial [Acidobacteriota bacterium]|nr:hypothetical protein [Acidobacteriota bacterium]